MAVVPDTSAVPSVAPQTQAPEDYQHVQTNPGQFGTLLAQGEEKLGAGATDAGRFYGQVAGDDATNQWRDSANKILYGDPDKTTIGPDGTSVPDTGYFGLRGADAMAQRPIVAKQLDELTKSTRNSLYTPESQLQFDSDSRRYRFGIDSDIGRHADQQQQTWTTSVNETTAKLALDDFARDPNNPSVEAQTLNSVLGARVKQAQANGTDPRLAVQQAQQEVALAKVRALLPTDAVGAQKALNDNVKVLSSLPNYDVISNEVKNKADEALAPVQAQQFIDQAKKTQPSPQFGNIKSAIVGQESGGNPAIGTSVNGAIGPGQVKPDTFAQYAQPGENIANPQDNLSVSGRIIDDYAQRYNNDPARIAVAYFSGPGNVAPAGSPTPYKADVKDGNGKSVSSYVSDVMGRLGVSTTIAPGIPDEEDVVNQVIAAGLPPEQTSRVFAQVEKQYTVLKQSQVAADKAKRNAALSSGNKFVSQILTDPTHVDVNAIANDQNLDWRDKSTINTMLRAALGRDDDTKDAKTYGDGFYDAYKAMNLPATDQNKISDPKQLWEMAGPGGKLTVAGVDKLTQIMAAKGTPEGDADHLMQEQFFKNAHKQLSFQDDNNLIPDPTGEKNYLRFMTQAFGSIDAGKKAGKTSAQLFNPDSPDYVGKTIATFKGSAADELARRVNAGLTDAGTAAPGAPDLTTSAGLYRALQNKQITVEQGKSLAIRRGWWKQPQPITAPVPAPTVSAPNAIQ